MPFGNRVLPVFSVKVDCNGTENSAVDRSVALFDLVAIFANDDILDPVQGVLYAPVPPDTMMVKFGTALWAGRNIKPVGMYIPTVFDRVLVDMDEPGQAFPFWVFDTVQRIVYRDMPVGMPSMPFFKYLETA